MTRYYRIREIAGTDHGVFDTIDYVAQYSGFSTKEVLQEIGFNNFRELADYKTFNPVRHFSIEYFVMRRLNRFLAKYDFPLRICKRGANQ